MKKLNIIDVFIIVLVILTLAGIGVRMGVNGYLNEKNNTEYYLTVKASGVDSVKENALRQGDEILFTDSSDKLGTIHAVTFENYITDENGQNSKCDVLFTVSIRGKNSENGFMLENGVYLYIGQSLVIESEGFEGEVLVMDINNKNE